MWAKHYERNLATVVIYHGSKEGIEKRVVVCSAYFAVDAEEFPPPQQVRDLIRDCEADGIDLLIVMRTHQHATRYGEVVTATIQEKLFWSF